jgi:DNA-directed RNA polymerase subunit RPC12/RpoP
MEKYICKECGRDVLVTEQKTIRSCEHTGTIVLQMDVVTSGTGGCDA